MKLRDITLDDVEDLLDMEGSRFDVLVAVCARAKDIHELENQLETPPSSPPKTRKRSSTAAGTSSSAASNKSNLPKKKKKSEQHPLPPLPLPEEFKNAIEEISTEPAKLVIEKALTVTDVNGTQCRLSIPIKQIREEFLTEEEKRFLRGYQGFKKNHKPVKVFEPSLATVTSRFCRWDMKKKNGGKTSSNYVINGNWMDIVERNGLRVGMVLQVWSFRVNGDLGLALVRLPTN